MIMKMKSPPAAVAVFMTRICTVNEVLVNETKATTLLVRALPAHYGVTST